MLHILQTGDICSLFSSIVILLMLGNLFADHRQKQIGGVLVVLAFLAHLGYSWDRTLPHSAEEVFTIILRSVAAAGFTLGLSWLVLPIVLRTWELVRMSLDASAKNAQEWQQQEHARREREQFGPLEAQERERARMQAEEHARHAADAQRRRDEARAGCELLFVSHEPDIRDRFVRSLFDAFMSRHLADDKTPEYVEERARELREVILKHLAKVQAPPKQMTLAKLVEWYLSEKQQIETTAVGTTEDKELLLAQLAERYHRLLETYLHKVEPS